MTLPDVTPFLASPDEVGVCLTLPDGAAVYLSTEEADQLVECIYDAQSVDPALLHNAIAAQTALDASRGK